MAEMKAGIQMSAEHLLRLVPFWPRRQAEWAVRLAGQDRR